MSKKKQVTTGFGYPPDQLIETICQCALLVSAADGQISESEIQKVYQVRAVVEGFFKNRHAIEVLEKTENIEEAKEARTDHKNIVRMEVFTPAYIRKIGVQLGEIESVEDLIALYKLYASQIVDPFSQHVAAWAAKEVAMKDGYEPMSECPLEIMAEVWDDLDLTENEHYFRDIACPATMDEFEYIGPPLTDESALEEARQLDEALSGNEDSEVADILAELLGDKSLEDLTREVFEIDDDNKC